MSRLGLLTYYIGIEFAYMVEGILLVQRNHIQNLLEKLNMLDCAAVTTLWKGGIQLCTYMGSDILDYIKV